MPTKGYHSYRGKTSVWKIVLIVVLCLILFTALGSLLLQRYAVYEADGSIRFDLPWKQERDTVSDPPRTQPDEPSQSADMPQVVVDEPEAKRIDALRACELDESVLRGSADAALAALPEEINAVAVRVKNTKGELLYNSQLTSAIEANAVAGSSISRAVIEDLTAGDYHTIARISALHDSLYSFAHMADAAVLQLQHAGYIWYDPNSTFYLAPEKPLARQYLCDIARECAEMGFEELLFDSFGYPPGGRQSNIDVSQRTMTKTEALSLLADELRKAVKNYGTALSLELDAETVLAGTQEASGQDLSALAERFDRIYVKAEPEQLPALTAALGPYAAAFVPIVSEARADGSFLLQS